MSADRTLVRVGSLSKLLTWTAVMQLAEQGRVDLHADVNQYLADVRIPATYAQPVTLAHLGTTQAAWIFFFGQYAPAPRLLAFSLAAHLTFALTRALIGLAFLPAAYGDLRDRVPSVSVGRLNAPTSG